MTRTHTSPAPAHHDQATKLRAMVAGVHAQDLASSRAPSTDHRVLRATPTRPSAHPLANSRTKIVAIASGKGGVGKSSLAVSLATSIARQGSRVTLLDGDIGLANTDILCGVRVRQHLGHVLDGKCDVRDVCINTPQGFRLVPGASGLAKIVQAADDRPSALMQRLAPITNDTDILLIDCGAGISRIVRAFMAAADLPLVVVTPEPTSITDAYALLKIATADRAKRAQRQQIPSLYLNMATDLKQAHQVHERLRQVCLRFLKQSPDLLGWCPTDPAIPRSVQARIPVVIHEPKAKSSKSIRATTNSLLQQLVANDPPLQQGGFISRLLYGLHRMRG